MADSPYIFCNFPSDIGIKSSIQLVGRASKHKVLPDKQSQLVADIKEIVIRIVTAAPDANTVIIRCHRFLQKLSGTLFIDAPKQIILRYIVRTHGKDTDAVHLMGKLPAPFIRFRIDLHPAKPDTLFPLVQNLHSLCTRSMQKHVCHIQGLAAVTVRPPERRIVHDYLPSLFNRKTPAVRRIQPNHNFQFFIQRLFRCPPFDSGTDLVRHTWRRCRFLQQHVKRKPHPALRMLLPYIDLSQPCLFYGKQIHRTKNTQIRKPWSPIPSKHAMRFP